jgi:hypothetical protein
MTDSIIPNVELGQLEQRTDYFSTVAGTSFGTKFDSGSRASDGSIDLDTTAALDGVEYQKGSVVKSVWNSAVFGPAFNPPDGGIADRDETSMSADFPLLQGAGGHDSYNFGYTGYTKLTRDGKVLWSGKLAGDLNTDGGGVAVPASAGTYRLTTALDRRAPWARLSRHVEVDWTFKSKSTDDSLPLQHVEWSPALDGDNRAPAGRFTVPLKVYDVDRSEPAKVRTITVDVSYNQGKTWSRARLSGSGATRSAAVNNPHGGTVSLRAAVTDPSGNHVTQTVLAAYSVR